MKHEALIKKIQRSGGMSKGSHGAVGLSLRDLFAHMVPHAPFIKAPESDPAVESEAKKNRDPALIPRCRICLPGRAAFRGPWLYQLERLWNAGVGPPPHTAPWRTK